MPHDHQRRHPPAPDNQASFGDFEASELFCPKCRQSMPVRRRLLLILPDGDLYEYSCRRCGTKVGSKRDKKTQPLLLVRE